ncbi:MAG: FtsW/RodA/SpoVE family cell cycle protein [Oscillospiraceae bacterium]|jgi:rod shape determining protein RodA|nr:FtsW/RodA/SpoVE family cell cycle protein [Oscillospiraceae bacterium]
MRKFFDAVGKYVREADMVLLVLCLVSALYGLVLVSSASRSVSGSQVFVQVVAIVLGLLLFVLFSIIDIDVIADKYRVLIVIGLLFIASLFIFGTGEEETGNKAWLRFSFGFGIQPAEIVKVPFVIILARMLSRHRDRRMMNSVWSMTRVLLVFLAFFGLIVVSSKDLGSALVYVFILLVMMYMGGVYLRWFALGIAAVGASAPILWTRFLSENQKIRILVVYDPSLDPTGLGKLWHQNLSVQAIKLGRFFGSGLYKGRITQSGIIPAQHSDFILSAAGEEFGFVGVMVIFGLLLAIIARCLYVGIKSNDKLGMLVCSGIAAMLIFQTLENIGMCLKLTPVVGLTLPFFSYGGSSILTVFVAAGLVCGIKMRPKPARFRQITDM